MISNILSVINNVFQTEQVRKTAPVKQNYSNNPFGNRFITQNNTAQEGYGKNRPVAGGFFAGYYNGKPNIVGTRLFVEV